MKKSGIILIVFVILKFILQYSLINPEYELHRDEYLHLDQGNHLAWGFLSVPPVSSWQAFIINALGNSVFWVKFFPALFGALTIVAVWKTVEELKGGLYACILAASGVLLSVLLRLNMLFQPNSLEVLLWTMFYFCVIKYINSDRVKWLYAGAIFLGIGFLNKYNIVFSLLGLIPAILLSVHRKIFLQKHFYFAALLALLIILPNMVWQFQNDFPVIHHMKELSERQLVNVSRLDFIKSQFLFFLGSILVIMAGFYALLFYRPFEKFKFFFWSYIFTIALFLLLKAKDYYAIGVYPVYISFGAIFLADRFERLKQGAVLRIAFVSIVIVAFIPLYRIAFPNKSPEYIVSHQEPYKKLGLLRWEDGKDHPLPQDFADMLGWKELAEKTDREYEKLSKTGKTLVLCDNYGQAGAINFYSEKGIKAVSFNADYINWFDLGKPYHNLIRIKEFSDNELEKTSPFFKTGKISDSITNPFAREKGTLIFSFQGAKININKRIQNEVDAVKADY
ncbi:glycosyltransferase family 39 protein [Chryseobacterium cheonjiense]|uniref:Glycosyltransferase family 39 protein n=1 Tax=Chryseobacterium cheonjiense TaxID=2728845 RepID=A0A7Y0A3J0_9FLAO|nr:glycosyltransferase family 39 protein [Chryseobacterium cheonjiense]NML55982.1 glycosyltransferase family 39 protein [Chryseobacterium cheonjiense]